MTSETGQRAQDVLLRHIDELGRMAAATKSGESGEPSRNRGPEDAAAFDPPESRRRNPVGHRGISSRLP